MFGGEGEGGDDAIVRSREGREVTDYRLLLVGIGRAEDWEEMRDRDGNEHGQALPQA